MWSWRQNNTGIISATLAVVILWIFWPILSPTLMILNSIAFLPFILLFTFIGTIGEGVLFTISLGCFGLFVKDNFAKDGKKSSKLEDSEEANDILGAGTTRVDVIKENIIQEDTSESKTADYSEVSSVTEQVLKDIEDHEVLEENNVQDSSEPKPSDNSELSGLLEEVLEDAEEHDILAVKTALIDLLKENDVEEDTSESETSDYSELASVSDQVLTDVEDQEVIKENNVQEDSSETAASGYSEFSSVTEEALEEYETAPISACDEIFDSNFAVHDALDVLDTIVEGIFEDDVTRHVEIRVVSVSYQVLHDEEDHEVIKENNVQEDSSETNASGYSEMSSVIEEVLKDTEENETEPISACNEITDSSVVVQDVLDVLDAIVEGIIEDDEVSRDQPRAVHLYGTAVGWNLQKA
eukprot:GFUD01039279.1.p1 GENE.GFUD01039279.1~~GFUD01039279.1.p1  ORF type:complete len:412 (-),score=80.36 GFUD01039279.1:84-1319(-)